MSDNRQDRAAEVRWALATENTELRERNEELKAKLTAAAKIIQEREDMCDGANEAIVMYKKRIAELEIVIETANTRREIIHDIVQKKRERITELEAENERLCKVDDKRIENLRQAAERRMDLEDENARLKAENSNLCAEVGELREQVSSLKGQNYELERMVSLETMQAVEKAEAEPEPTPGFFNAENMHYLHKMSHNHERRISALEEGRRESEGEL